MCGRASDQPAVRKGPSVDAEEDLILASYISQHGEGSWDKLARAAGLCRSGKSCRLRWLNYLRPGVRRGSITLEEDAAIRELHATMGNKWSNIAKHLPGRTDNEVKNYWRTRIQIRKKPASTQLQSSADRAPPDTASTAAASEGASSSSPSASHDDGDHHGRSSSDAGESYMQPSPDQQQQAYHYYHHQNAMAAPSLLASQDDSFITGGGYGHMQQASSYPYYSESELGSVVDHVKTTTQFFSSDISDCFWDVVDNFWEA